jgi:hypothetical protein
VGDDFVKNFTAKFSEGLDVDPERLAPAFARIGNTIADAAELGQVVEPSIIKDSFQNLFKLDPLVRVVSQAIADCLNASQRAAENAANAANRRAQIDIEFITDQDLPRALQDSFDEANIALQTGTTTLREGLQEISRTGFGFDQTQFTEVINANKNGLEQLVKVADTAEDAVSATLERFRKTTFASADAEKALGEVLSDQEGNFKEASNAVNSTNQEVNATRKAMQLLETALEKSKQAVRNRAEAERAAIGENDQLLAQSRRDEATQIAEINNQINRLRATAAQIQVSGAERAGADPFTKATTAFDQSVNKFDLAVRLLTQAARSGEGVGGTPEAAPLSEAQRQGALTEGAFGIGGGFGELRNLLKQQIDSTSALTLDNLGALFSGGFEQVAQNVTETAIRGLAERQQGVLARQGIEVDATLLANQIRLAVTNGFNAANFQSILEASLTGEQTGRIETLLEALSERATPEAAPEQTEKLNNAVTETGNQVSGLNESIIGLNDKLANQTETQNETVQTTDALETQLAQLESSTAANTSAVETATSEQKTQSSELIASLQGASQQIEALGQGVEVQLEAMQQLDLNVNLSESVESLKQEFEGIAKRAALGVVEQALSQLASNSTDQDRQTEINDTLEGLA